MIHLRFSAIQVREAARNNVPSSLALPFDRLRERSMGKLFPGGSLSRDSGATNEVCLTVADKLRLSLG
jgi:hypothetical protein